MPKTPSKRKIPVRKILKHKIKKDRSYTAKDVNDMFGIDESVFHRWVREEGLITIDDKKPSIVHGTTFHQFADHKDKSSKMETGNAGDFPCFGCFMKRRAFESKITIKKPNDMYWKAKATCSCCGSIMNMNVTACEFLLTITWGYQLVETLPVLTIRGGKDTSVRTSGRQERKKTKFNSKSEVNFHPDNERIKHKYFIKIERKYDKKKTVPKIISSISDYEEYSGYKCFKSFCYDDVDGFQKYIIKKYGHSMQTAHRTMNYVREFLFWLREQDSYKKIKYDDVDDLHLSLKDQERAKASKPKDYLDASKWQDLILSLKPETDVEYRGQAMLAALLLTGARIDALISFNIGDFNLNRNYAFQDAEHVNSKFASSWKTNLWKFKPELRQILDNWINKLITEHGFSNDDPLFPRANITTNELSLFQHSGFIKEPIKSQSILRDELYKQLEKAGLAHYTPHTIRNSLIALFFSMPLTPEQQKAVSQNMSHKNLATTVNGYYKVSEYRQDAIIEELDVEHLLKMQKLRDNPKLKYIMAQLDNEEAINKAFATITKD
ncbi:MAG: site-specific integrase [Rickettsiales bacterium]